MPKLTLLTMFLTILATGCATQPPCVEQQVSAQAGTSQLSDEAPFRGSGNPYEPGPLTVRTIALDACENAAPVPLQIHAPAESGVYSVVVFQHGFMATNIMYSEVLRHLAGHGFVVVAPQLYEPGIGPLFGVPTADDDAVVAASVLDWVSAHLADVVGVGVRTDLLGLAGHSRGGKVAWLVLNADSSRAKAVVGLDPVDGTGGPFVKQSYALQGTVPFAIPSLLIGTGLGGDWAPVGENHVKFYEAAQSPSWHVVAPDYGHADMLDDEWVASFRNLGASGDDPAKMRQLTAGLLVAFFRASLQGDATAYAYLTDTSAAPARIEAESK
jgi:chlorophyllase